MGKCSIDSEGEGWYNWVMIEIFKGRPLDMSGRTEREAAVYDYLDRLGIDYDRLDHEPAQTAEVCERITEALSPATACKNLFLTNSKGDEFFLLVMRADKHFTGRIVAHQIGSTRLSFGSAEKLWEYLGVTSGSVSLLSLVNDKNCRVQLLVDEDVYNSPLIRCHPCVNTSSLRIGREDAFFTFVSATGHSLRVVKM